MSDEYRDLGRRVLARMSPWDADWPVQPIQWIEVSANDEEDFHFDAVGLNHLTPILPPDVDDMETAMALIHEDAHVLWDRDGLSIDPRVGDELEMTLFPMTVPALGALLIRPGVFAYLAETSEGLRWMEQDEYFDLKRECKLIFRQLRVS